MAISANQLQVHTMVESSKEDYSTATETTSKDNFSDSSMSTLSSDSLTSKFTKPNIKDINALNQKQGIFSKILCCKMPSLSLRMPSLKLGFLRDLNFDPSFNVNICGKEKKVNPFDSIMSAAKFIQQNPGILSGSVEDRLNSLLKTDILDKMGILGLGGIVPTCILGKSISTLYGSDTGNGPSLRSRNALKTLLYQDPCTAMLANIPLVSDWLSNSNTAALISTLLSADKDKAFSFIDACLGILGQRESVLGNILLAWGAVKDYNTRAELDLLNRVINTGKLTGKDYILIQRPVKDIVDALDKEKEEKNPVTKDPVGDFNNYINIFDKLNPSWNLWDVKCNKTMTELANAKLQSTYTKDMSLTGEYTTTLTRDNTIAAMNAFCCTCN